MSRPAPSVATGAAGPAEGPAGLDYGGHCARCGRRHALAPSAEALTALGALVETLSHMDRLPTEAGAAGPPIAPRFAEGGGQMIGLLVARDVRGRHQHLRAFSGQWDGRARVAGWAPPLVFAEGEPEWKRRGEAELDALGEGIAAARATTHAERRRLEAGIQAARRELVALRAALRAERARSRKRRAHERARLSAALRATDGTADGLARAGLEEGLRALDRASRREKAAQRRSLAAARRAVERLETEMDGLERPARQLLDQRRQRSRRLLARIQGAYRVPDRSGGEMRLRQAFLRPAAIPSGAGDCCAPKLLAWANRRGLEPLALAEMWFGAGPPAGGREHGRLYGACERLCAPLLGAMLCPEPAARAGPADGREACDPARERT